MIKMAKEHKFYQFETSSSKPDDEPLSKVVLRSIKLNPDISSLNFFASQIHNMVMVFSFSCGDSLQPLILLDRNYYNIDKGTAGTTLSMILFAQLIVKLITATIYGHLNDKLGRRKMLVYGAISKFIGFILAPVWHNVYPGFVFSKILISNGSTALITLPFTADYVHNDSKGKSTALAITLSTIGAFCSNIFIKALLYNNFSLKDCYWITGSFSFVLLILNATFLKGGKYHLENDDSTSQENVRSFKQNLKEAVEEFKSNAWLTISLVLQILGNADFYIVFTMLALFVKSLFPPETDDKISNIAINNVQSFVFVPALFSNFFYGYRLDKGNKVMGSIYLALGGGVIAFSMTFFVSSPNDWQLYFASIILGTTLTGVYVIANFLGNRHFPAEKRGIMNGVSALIGYLGYVVIATGGGLLFDNWRKNAPFIVYAGLLIFAMILVSIIYSKRINHVSY